MAGNPSRTKYSGNEIFKALISKNGDILYIQGMDIEKAEKIGIDEQREEELLQEIEDLQSSQLEAIERLENLLADRDKFKQICIDNDLWREPLTPEQIAIMAAQEQAEQFRRQAEEQAKQYQEQSRKQAEINQTLLETMRSMQKQMKELKADGKIIVSNSNDKADDASISTGNGENIGAGKTVRTKVS